MWKNITVSECVQSKKYSVAGLPRLLAGCFQIHAEAHELPARGLQVALLARQCALAALVALM